MNRIIFIFIITLSFSSLSAQNTLKEVTKTFTNGQPMFVDYLDARTLKKVKTEFFNEDGDKIFSCQFNPNTGLLDGEFFDLKNKGYFKDGVLNCENCMLVEANTPSVFSHNFDSQNTIITYANVRDGYLVGEVNRYSIREKTFQKINWDATRSAVAYGAWVGFRAIDTYKTGEFIKTFLEKKKYNKNGVLDGEYHIYKNTDETESPPNNEWHAKLNVQNGIVKSYVAYDKNNIIVDSLSNSDSIWKIGYKFVKNNGFIRFKDPEEFHPNKLKNYYSPSPNSKPYFDDLKGRRLNFYFHQFESPDDAIIMIGGKLEGGQKLGLDANGLYTKNVIGAFDNIVKFDVNGYSSLGGWNYHDDGFKSRHNKDKKLNLLVLAYNYLTNDNQRLLNWKFFEYPSDGQETLKYLIIALQQDHYMRSDRPNALRVNHFSKYVKISPISEDGGSIIKQSNLKLVPNGPSGNSHSSTYRYTFSNFFTNVISLVDYLKACKESINSSSTEIQEIWLWNFKSKKWDKVDFDNLIKIASQKQKEIIEYGGKSSLSSFKLIPLNSWKDDFDYGRFEKIVNNYDLEKNRISLLKDSIYAKELKQREEIINKSKLEIEKISSIDSVIVEIQKKSKLLKPIISENISILTKRKKPTDEKLYQVFSVIPKYDVLNKELIKLRKARPLLNYISYNDTKVNYLKNRMSSEKENKLDLAVNQIKEFNEKLDSIHNTYVESGYSKNLRLMEKQNTNLKNFKNGTNHQIIIYNKYLQIHNSWWWSPEFKSLSFIDIVNQFIDLQLNVSKIMEDKTLAKTVAKEFKKVNDNKSLIEIINR